MSSVHLMGGGWDAAASSAMYGRFLDAAGTSPRVATVVLDEGDGPAQFERWETVMRRTGPCEPIPVLVGLGDTLDVAALGDADAVFVCGGLTPAYAHALVPAAPALRAWLSDGGRPFGGFSAGAAIAAEAALVGGWLDDGVPVCPEDAAEDLDEVGVVVGLALVRWTVDVHCAQWGTLPRLISALRRTGQGVGLGLDENTAVHVTGPHAIVSGTGSVYRVAHDGDGVRVAVLRSGDKVLQP